MFLIEEIQNVHQYYKDCQIIQTLKKRHKDFKDLSLVEKNEVRKFYDAKIRQLDIAQKLLCRESTIQIVLQLVLILYQVNIIKIKNRLNISHFNEIFQSLLVSLRLSSTTMRQI